MDTKLDPAQVLRLKKDRVFPIFPLRVRSLFGYCFSQILCFISSWLTEIASISTFCVVFSVFLLCIAVLFASLYSLVVPPLNRADMI